MVQTRESVPNWEDNKAREFTESALKLATCDGPPYYYKVAYEEAERMLERMKAE